MQLSKRFFLVLSSMLVIVPAFAVNCESVVGQYSTLKNKPTTAQQDLLSQTIQVHFPEEIQTINQAIHYVLRYSGYALADPQQESVALKNTLQKPLPLVDRDFGPMPLKDALATLIGPAFILHPDILNRTINFTLKPKFVRKDSLCM